MKTLSAKESNTMSSSLSSCEEYADLEKYAAIERRWQTVERTIALCGAVCTECPAFLATEKDDEREKTADLWSKQYNAETKPEDINCEGCFCEAGRILGYCKLREIGE